MNTERFSKLSDGFDLLGLRAQFRWRTTGSICFYLCRPIPQLRAYAEVGWLDVHYPLLDRDEFDSKTFLRGRLPESVDFHKSWEAIPQIRQALGIRDRGGTLLDIEYVPDRVIDMERLARFLEEMRSRPELADRSDREVTVFGNDVLFPAWCQFH